MIDWKLIENPPEKPTPVAYFRSRLWDDLKYRTDEPGRDERFDAGYWDGETFREKGTAHPINEWEWQTGIQRITHYAEITPPSGDTP